MATVKIFRRTGASGSPTDTDVTSINSRLNAVDSHSTGGTTNPVKIPNSGTNYSYWGSFRIKVTSNTGSNTIDNMKFYTDGSNNFGTGISGVVASASGYAQATGTQGTTGDELTTSNYADLNESPSDAFGYTSGSALDLTTSGTGTSASGFIGDYAVYQIQVDDTASVGASSQETNTFQYDVS